jgi:hypothetical protein
VPNGCASRNACVLRSATPLKPVRPTLAGSATSSGTADARRSPKATFAAHSVSLPRSSIWTPHKRAATVAFQTRGFGK